MRQAPLWRSAAAALVLGGLSATGFAPLDLWPVALLCFAGFILILRQMPDKRSTALAGWCFGVGHFSVGLNWIATAFTFQDAMPHWLGWVAVVLLSFYFAVFPALAALCAKVLAGPGLLSFTLLLAGAWSLSELLRATLFTGFAWNPLGVMLADVGQAARWIGSYGLSAIVILASGAVAALFLRKWRTAIILAAPAALSVVVAVAGPAAPPPAADATLLHIVQPNINQNEKWSEEMAARNFRRLAALTTARSDRPRLILWPEAAVPDFLEEEPWARARLAGLMNIGDTILTGATKLEYEPGSSRLVAARNSLFAVDSRSLITGRYDKSHLVPFGEYLPLRDLLSTVGLSRLAPGDLDFWPGPGPATLAVPGFGQVGAQICYEIIFSGHVVDRANRPEFIFNPSNDAWFGRWGPPQHLAQARLRAVEEGLPVVRSTPTGISAVIDADGRVLQSIGWRKAGAITAPLPSALPPTLFARYGNILSILFALTLIVIAIAVRRNAR